MGATVGAPGPQAPKPTPSALQRQQLSGFAEAVALGKAAGEASPGETLPKTTFRSAKELLPR
eukprot:7427596-Alexandrium_andersonii.AAC.1